MPKLTRKPVKSSDWTISKSVLAAEISKAIEEQSLTQAQAASMTADAPSQMSLMMSGKLQGFSAQRLIRTLTRLGRDVDIVIRKSDKAGKLRLTIKQ